MLGPLKSVSSLWLTNLVYCASRRKWMTTALLSPEGSVLCIRGMLDLRGFFFVRC